MIFLGGEGSEIQVGSGQTALSLHIKILESTFWIVGSESMFWL